jgi:hypothetical protein
MELNQSLHVMRGLDPRIHLLRKMDCIGSRVYPTSAMFKGPQVGNIRLAGVKPGNDHGEVQGDWEEH